MDPILIAVFLLVGLFQFVLQVTAMQKSAGENKRLLEVLESINCDTCRTANLASDIREATEQTYDVIEKPAHQIGLINHNLAGMFDCLKRLEDNGIVINATGETEPLDESEEISFDEIDEICDRIDSRMFDSWEDDRQLQIDIQRLVEFARQMIDGGTFDTADEIDSF